MSDTPEEPIVEQPAEPIVESDDGKGLGDHVAAALNAVGGEAVADFIARVTKKPCNCGQRQQRLNAIGSSITTATKSTTDYVRQRVQELSRKGNN